MGFISLTVFLALHGLSVPGFLLGANSVVGVAEQFSFLFTGIFLWLSTLPSNNRYIAFLGRRNRLLLIAVSITVFSLTLQFSFGETIGLALQGLFTDNPTERIMAGISPKVRALITAAETHDSHTAGHAERMALSAI